MTRIALYIAALFAMYAFPLLSVIQITPPKKCNSMESTVETYESLNKLLHENPYAFLQLHKKCFAKMDRIKTSAEFEAANQEMRKTNPLWVLGECFADYCPLTRTKNQDPRALFESMITQALLRKSATSHQPINYLSFASGYGLTDFIALIKAFDSGAQAINFHVIESQNQGYIATVEQFRKSQVEAFESMPALAEILSSTINDAELKAGLQDDAIAEYLYILWKHELYSQMAHWIGYRYQKVQFKIFLYRSVDEYKKYIDENNHLIADVFGAIDFGDQDKRSKQLKTRECFDDLNAFVATRNQRAFIYYDADGTDKTVVKKNKHDRNCDSNISLAIIGLASVGIAWLAYNFFPAFNAYCESNT